MNHDELLEIHAFVDDELDVARRLALEQTMARDPALRARVDDIRAVRDATRADADYHTAPDALRRRIEAMVRPMDPVADVRHAASPQTGGGWPRATTTAWTHWWGWRPLSTALAATVVLTFGTQMYLAHRSRDMQLVDEVVASHVRSTLGEHSIDIASSDHHMVKPWLSSKLDFSPPVRDTDIGSAVFLGGRLDYVDNRPVAALVYRQGPHLVDTFIWPGSGNRGISFENERGYQIAHWTRDGMTHWVISDINRAEFLDLVQRLASPIPAS